MFTAAAPTPSVVSTNTRPSRVNFSRRGGRRRRRFFSGFSSSVTSHRDGDAAQDVLDHSLGVRAAARRVERALQGAGAKPIIGVDALVRNHKEANKPHRLLLLVRNREGYLNLTRLVSRSYREGQHIGMAMIDPEWFALVHERIPLAFVLAVVRTFVFLLRVAAGSGTGTYGMELALSIILWILGGLYLLATRLGATVDVAGLVRRFA